MKHKVSDEKKDEILERIEYVMTRQEIRKLIDSYMMRQKSKATYLPYLSGHWSGNYFGAFMFVTGLINEMKVMSSEGLDKLNLKIGMVNKPEFGNLVEVITHKDDDFSVTHYALYLGNFNDVDLNKFPNICNAISTLNKNNKNELIFHRYGGADAEIIPLNNILDNIPPEESDSYNFFKVKIDIDGATRKHLEEYRVGFG